MLMIETRALVSLFRCSLATFGALNHDELNHALSWPRRGRAGGLKTP